MKQRAPLAFACGAKSAAEFLRGEGTAVQSKTMARGAREAVLEQPRHVLRRDADSVVLDRDDAGRDGRDAQGDLLVGAARVVAGVLGVAHQVDDDSQHFVLIDLNAGDLAEFAAHRHAMAANARAFGRRLSSTRSTTSTVSVTPQSFA